MRSTQARDPNPLRRELSWREATLWTRVVVFTTLTKMLNRCARLAVTLSENLGDRGSRCLDQLTEMYK